MSGSKGLFNVMRKGIAGTNSWKLKLKNQIHRNITYTF